MAQIHYSVLERVAFGSICVLHSHRVRVSQYRPSRVGQNSAGVPPPSREIFQNDDFPPKWHPLPPYAWAVVADGELVYIYWWNFHTGALPCTWQTKIAQLARLWFYLILPIPLGGTYGPKTVHYTKNLVFGRYVWGDITKKFCCRFLSSCDEKLVYILAPRLNVFLGIYTLYMYNVLTPAGQNVRYAGSETQNLDLGWKPAYCTIVGVFEGNYHIKLP